MSRTVKASVPPDADADATFRLALPTDWIVLHAETATAQAEGGPTPQEDVHGSLSRARSLGLVCLAIYVGRSDDPKDERLMAQAALVIDRIPSVVPFSAMFAAVESRPSTANDRRMAPISQLALPAGPAVVDRRFKRVRAGHRNAFESSYHLLNGHGKIGATLLLSSPNIPLVGPLIKLFDRMAATLQFTG